MRSRALLVVLSTAFILGCSETPVEVPADVELAAALAPGGLVNSATGSGHITTTARRTFTFSAHERADGTVSGQFQLVIHNDDPIRLHAEVVCMSVAGNRAWVGGVVTSATNPAWVGLETAWAVEDNGAGNPSPDLISLMNVPAPGLAQPNCDSQARVPDRPLEGGNVRVD